MSVRIIQGDCLEVIPTFQADSFDSIVTDPPYHLTTGKKGGTGLKSVNLNTPHGRSRITTGGFMGKHWDGGDVAFRAETWEQAIRVMKPGSYLLAFGGTRTFHRLTCAIEDAGFEIQDCLSWLYGSGFPKHKSKLKPAWEPIIMARKPAPKATHLNIDACRIPATDGANFNRVLCTEKHEGWQRPWNDDPEARERAQETKNRAAEAASALGRWPANVVLDEVAAGMLDEMSGEMRARGNVTPTKRRVRTEGWGNIGAGENGGINPGDTGGASRFMYCAKASRSERNAGLDGRAEKPLNWSAGTQNPGAFQSENTHRASQNFHPTVKPVSLMRWLVRLVTPEGGTVLDPFTGSGTTGIAATLEGFRFIGIERDPEYAAIAERRIAETPASLFTGCRMTFCPDCTSPRVQPWKKAHFWWCCGDCGRLWIPTPRPSEETKPTKEK